MSTACHSAGAPSPAARRRALVPLLVAALGVGLLGGCGGGDEPPGAAATTSTTASPAGERERAQAVVTTDPALGGQWSAPFAMGLIAVHMALLPDGRVMYYGTRRDGQQTAYFEVAVWDPSAGTGPASVQQLANTTGTDFFCSAQTLLPTENRLFIAGGDMPDAANTPNLNTNLWDWVSGAFTRTTDMNRARWYASTTTLMNGEVYLQGGTGGGDRPEVRRTDGSFRLLQSVATGNYDTYFPRNWVAPDGRVFGVEGQGRMYFVDTAGNGTLTSVGQLPQSLSGALNGAAMFRPGHILKLSSHSASAAVIDISRGNPVVRDTEANSALRVHGVATVLADGRVLSTGGSTVDNQLASAHYSAEVWDPVTGRWTVGLPHRNARLYHGTALLLPDARVLLAGGGAPGPLVNTNGELYTPSYLLAADGSEAPRPAIVEAPTEVDPGQVLALTADRAGVSRVTLVRFGSVSHSWNSDQRFLDLPFRADPSAPQRLLAALPSRATDTPPGFYLLFVFDANGVPSVARTVKMALPGARDAASPPTMADLPDQRWDGGAVQLQVATTGSGLQHSASGLPPGLTVDARTGAVTGRPTRNGTYHVTLAADDGRWTATRSFRFEVDATPVNLSPPVPPGPTQVGDDLRFDVAVQGLGAQVSWNFGDGSPATAWSPDTAAVHRYAAPGLYTVTVTAIDSQGLPQTRSFLQLVHRALTARQPVQSSQFAWHVGATGRATLWVVNPDADSVSAIDPLTRERLAEVSVGRHPGTIALAADGQLWVTNRRSASLSLIDPVARRVTRTLALPPASQPHGVVADPAGTSVFVSLEAAGRVLRYDALRRARTGALGVGPNPRHLALDADGRVLHVSRFITPPLPGEGTARVKTVSAGTARGGEVLLVDSATLRTTGTVVLAHSERADAENQGRGIPNYLGALAISPDGTQAWLPSKQDNVLRGALRDGLPLNFQNTVRAVSSRLPMPAGLEDLGARLDHDNASLASAAAWDRRGVLLFVALETSREVAVIDAHRGAQLLRVETGLAPQAVTLSPDGMTLAVHNAMSRSVGLYDLAPLLQRGQLDLPALGAVTTVASEPLSPEVLRGKQLFYDARDTRLARDRYMSCASCHQDGGHDGRTWDMTGSGEGLRNTIALRGRAGLGHGPLHWSGNFDEVQDFEGQIRNLAGGTGLMDDSAYLAGTRREPLGDRKAGLSADLDALAAYVGSLQVVDPSPWRAADGSLTPEAVAGRALFATQCASCHGGHGTTDSTLDARHATRSIKPASGRRNGQPLLGLDTPGLRDAWATAPYLHDGSQPTLYNAIRAHANPLLTNDEVTRLAAYVSQIGDDEPPPPPPVGGLTGRLYPNDALAGQPVAMRPDAVDGTVDVTAWSSGVASGPSSVRWRGELAPLVSGSHAFELEAAGGVRLWVDGQAVIDDWAAGADVLRTRTGSVTLDASRRHAVTIEYRTAGAAGAVRWRWQPPGQTALGSVPASRLHADSLNRPYNAGWEQPRLARGGESGAAPGWLLDGGAVVAAAGGRWSLPDGRAAEGLQVAALPDGGRLVQRITVEPGEGLALEAQGDGSARLQVRLAGRDLATLTPSAGRWSTQGVGLPVGTRAEVDLELRAVGGPLLLDALRLVRTPASVTVRPADATLLGTASWQADGSLRFTSTTGQLGTAWLSAPRSTAEPFTVSFDYRLQATNGRQADGIAFVLQPGGVGVQGGGGGCIGTCLPNWAGAMVLTYTNNRVGLATNGRLAPAAGVDLGAQALVTGRATVRWDPAARRLLFEATVVTGASSRTVTDTLDIDLGARMGPTVWAGLAGATGGSGATQAVSGWTIGR